MAVSARKHTVPAEGETPRFEAINELGASVNDFIPVANVTERAQVIANLTAAGAPPSTARPVFVWRADAPTAVPVEFTTDGTTWTALAAQQSADVTTFGSGWTATNDTTHKPRVTRIGNRVFITGAVTRSTGSTGNLLTVPSAFQPPSTGTRFIGAVWSSAGTGGMLALSSGVVSVPAGYGNLGGTGSIVVPVIGNWTMD